MGKSTVEALLAGWSSCSSLELPLSKYPILLYWRYILTRSWWEALPPGPGGASIPRYSRIMLFRASSCRPLYVSSMLQLSCRLSQTRAKNNSPNRKEKALCYWVLHGKFVLFELSLCWSEQWMTFQTCFHLYRYRPRPTGDDCSSTPTLKLHVKE